MMEEGERAFSKTLANRQGTYPGQGDPRSEGQIILPASCRGFGYRRAPPSSPSGRVSRATWSVRWSCAAATD